MLHIDWKLIVWSFQRYVALFSTSNHYYLKMIFQVSDCLKKLGLMCNSYLNRTLVCNNFQKPSDAPEATAPMVKKPLPKSITGSTINSGPSKNLSFVSWNSVSELINQNMNFCLYCRDSKTMFKMSLWVFKQKLWGKNHASKEGHFKSLSRTSFLISKHVLTLIFNIS